MHVCIMCILTFPAVLQQTLNGKADDSSLTNDIWGLQMITRKSLDRADKPARAHLRLALGSSIYYMWPDLRNPPYVILTRFAQCAFLVAQVQICQSPDFVISMSNNPSSNCSRRLRRLVVSYKGEISLHFDPPSLYSCRVRSPLLREIIRIRARGLSSYC